jgi:hypothetical protein
MREQEAYPATTIVIECYMITLSLNSYLNDKSPSDQGSLGLFKTLYTD